MTVSDPSSAVPLPPERAFVIQLQAATHGGAEPFAGRAEHVASGEAARFGSIPELIAFVRHVLATDGHRLSLVDQPAPPTARGSGTRPGR